MKFFSGNISGAGIALMGYAIFSTGDVWIWFVIGISMLIIGFCLAFGDYLDGRDYEDV